MAKKIRRQILINGVKKWICGNTEQEYADNLIKALQMDTRIQIGEQKHKFCKYADEWFRVFSAPNVEYVTGTTYKRQLQLHINPVLGELNIEDILPADVQRVFNEMSGAKETKLKAKIVLNMIFEQAMEDGFIQKNPLKSKSIRIIGRGSKATAPYTVAQMRYLIRSIPKLTHSEDRAYLALHALHPLRLEEVLGLKWKDIDLDERTISIERAVTHPTRNQPHIKDTKTEASVRELDLVPQIIQYLEKGAQEMFVLGGREPLTYTQLRRMCQRIKRETGFEETITPRRFRTTVLTDIYDTTKDIKQTQFAAGHTTAAMTLKHYVKNRQHRPNTAMPIAVAYGLKTDN